MHPDAVVRRRALSPKELAAAFAGAQEISGVARRWKDRAHHPVALAIYAAQKAGWQFVNAVTLRDASGQERSLVHGSPAALRQLLLQDLSSSNASRDACAAAQRLEAPSGIVEDLLQRGVWLLPVQKLIRSRASGGLTRSEAARLVQAVTGQLWTGAVLARRGILASPDCPHCGAEDTVFHRVWTCPFGQSVRRDVASADLIRAAVAAGPTSPLFARALASQPPVPEVTRDGGLVVHWARTVDGAEVFRPQQGAIFVDGSAVNPRPPAIASAACAAVQVDAAGQVLASLRAAVPRGWPQTAACAERLVIGLVAQFVHDHCDVYSDCQGVVQEWDHPSRATDARAVWGGLWRQIFRTQTERRHCGGIGRILKCKAHRLKEDCEQGEPHDLYVWHGNDAADRAAKEAALTATLSRVDIAQYESEYARAVEVARTFGRVLALWPPARLLYSGRAAGERVARATKTDGRGGMHQWRLLPAQWVLAMRRLPVHDATAHHPARGVPGQCRAAGHARPGCYRYRVQTRPLGSHVSGWRRLIACVRAVRSLCPASGRQARQALPWAGSLAGRQEIVAASQGHTAEAPRQRCTASPDVERALRALLGVLRRHRAGGGACRSAEASERAFV